MSFENVYGWAWADGTSAMVGLHAITQPIRPKISRRSKPGRPSKGVLFERSNLVNMYLIFFLLKTSGRVAL
jgi:hypothetical protein